MALSEEEFCQTLLTEALKDDPFDIEEIDVCTLTKCDLTSAPVRNSETKHVEKISTTDVSLENTINTSTVPQTMNILNPSTKVVQSHVPQIIQKRAPTDKAGLVKVDPTELSAENQKVIANMVKANAVPCKITNTPKIITLIPVGATKPLQAIKLEKPIVMGGKPNVEGVVKQQLDSKVKQISIKTAAGNVIENVLLNTLPVGKVVKTLGTIQSTSLMAKEPNKQSDTKVLKILTPISNSNAINKNTIAAAAMSCGANEKALSTSKIANQISTSKQGVPLANITNKPLETNTAVKKPIIGFVNNTSTANRPIFKTPSAMGFVSNKTKPASENTVNKNQQYLHNRKSSLTKRPQSTNATYIWAGSNQVKRIHFMHPDEQQRLTAANNMFLPIPFAVKPRHMPSPTAGTTSTSTSATSKPPIAKAPLGSFFNSTAIYARVRQLCREQGLESPNPDAVCMIGKSLHIYLTNLIEKMLVMAEHRVDSIALDSTRYHVTNDIRAKTRFLAEVEQTQDMRSKGEDFDQSWRFRDNRGRFEQKIAATHDQKRLDLVNQTALEAIGTRRKAGEEISTMLRMVKPRMRRIVLQDAIYVMENDRHLSKSDLLFKYYFHEYYKGKE